MIRLKIILLSVLAITGCHTNNQYLKGFTTQINHTAFLERKTGWSKVNTFKPIMMVYQPKRQLIIVYRSAVPDSLHLIPLSQAELEPITKEYGDFKFLGAFEDHHLPAEFSHLIYINPSKMDVLQVDRITVDAKGTEKLTGAILYMQHAVNYMSDSRLFLRP